MQLDAATLLTAITLVECVGALLFFLVWKITPHQSASNGASIRIWAGALALSAIGGLLIGLRGPVPETVSIVVGHGLVLLGVSLRCVALSAFWERKPRTYLALIPMLIWLVLCAYPDFLAHGLYPTLFTQGVLTLVCLWAAFLCFRHNKDRFYTARWLGIALLTEGNAHLVLAAKLRNVELQTLVMAFEQWFMSVFFLVLLITTVAIVILAFSMVIEKDQFLFRAQARKDSLTGLANRRAFYEMADGWLSANRRKPKSFTLVMMDVDRFKTINDTYGHPLGDAILQLLGRICKDTLGSTVVAGRLGGEEFALFFPDTSREKALVLAERIRQRFAKGSEDASAGHLRATLSAGLAEGKSGTTTLDEAIKIADVGLYKAKRLGRDQIAEATREDLRPTPVAAKAAPVAAEPAKAPASRAPRTDTSAPARKRSVNGF